MSNDEVVAACRAIEDGEFVQARHHINNLAMSGTNPSLVEELTRLIWQKEREVMQTTGNRIGMAISVAVFGYMALSFQSPEGWGPLVWGLVAFLILPCVVGVLAGNSVTASRAAPLKKLRFRRAFSITFSVVAIYTLVGMGIVRHKMQSADKSTDIAIYLVVAVVYGLMAGAVAGIAGSSFPITKRAS